MVTDSRSRDAFHGRDLKKHRLKVRVISMKAAVPGRA